MLRTKRRPLINLREWGKKIKLNRNTVLNEKPTEETSTEDSMTFSAPVNEPPSPTYTPVFSPLEEEEDEAQETITTHTTMEVKTIDTLNSGNINLIGSERDKMKLGGISRNHPLLFHFNRTLWPVLFATLQLKGMLPIDYDYDDKTHFTSFRLLLATQEEQVLDTLRKTYPTTKNSNVVELCSRIIFNIDPRFPTFLSQYGKVKQLIDTYSPTAEEEKMIVESWKKTWDEKILGPQQVKTQLKETIFCVHNNINQY